MLDEFTKIEIHWDDTTTIMGWHSREEMDAIMSRSPGRMVTVSWKIGENETHIFVSSTVGEMAAKDIMAIPKRCIVTD
jgi:hypothetical protein